MIPMELLNVPPAEIPAVVGELERAKAILLARLTQQPVENHRSDDLLTADQVAERLQVDKRWVYAHKEKLGVISLSRKQLRFPISAVDAYIRRRKAASERRR